MTTNQPDRIDRLEARINNLVTISENLVQTAEAHQQNLDRLAEQAAIDRQAFQTEIRRIWEYLLQQSGNGRGNQ